MKHKNTATIINLQERILVSKEKIKRANELRDQTVSVYEKDIKDLENEIKALSLVGELGLDKSITLHEIEKLAIIIHDNTCNSNHTDACGWYYEIKDNFHDWDGNSHKIYFERAVKLIQRYKAMPLTKDFNGAQIIDLYVQTIGLHKNGK